MTKLAVGSLVVGLVVGALSLPYIIPAYQEINRNTAQLKELNDEREAAQTVQPAPEEIPTPTPAAAKPTKAPTPAAEPATQAEAGPVSTGIATAFAQKQKPEPEPAPLLPGAGASVDVGGAPSCADLGDLKQAVNPNPRATQYRGQLLIGNGTGAKLKPCTRARTFGNTGQSYSTGRLPPGTYPAPGGTVTVGR